VLVLSPLGVYGQYLSESTGAPREFTTLAVVDAVMLMTTTLVAYLFAIRRRITQHRQWMTRSYAVALVFFEGRLVGGLLGIDSNVNATMAAIWACLALSMVFAELANSFHDVRERRRIPPRPRAVSRSA
jgi:ATP/ADP translocase